MTERCPDCQVELVPLADLTPVDVQRAQMSTMRKLRHIIETELPAATGHEVEMARQADEAANEADRVVARRRLEIRAAHIEAGDKMGAGGVTSEVINDEVLADEAVKDARFEALAAKSSAQLAKRQRDDLLKAASALDSRMATLNTMDKSLRVVA